MASDGYVLAGCDVIGVDIEYQSDYPYTMFEMDMFDALMDTDLLDSVDIIHASPPCQLFTRAKHLRDAQGGKSRTLDAYSLKPPACASHPGRLQAAGRRP